MSPRRVAGLQRTMLSALLVMSLVAGGAVAGMVAHRLVVRGTVESGTAALLDIARRWARVGSPAPATLRIDIPPDALRAIADGRSEGAHLDPMLSTGHTAPARLTFQGSTLEARARPAADGGPSGARLPIRIDVEGVNDLLGLRSFAIRDRTGRDHILHWMMLEQLRLEGIRAPRYLLARVVLNGRAEGVLGLEESPPQDGARAGATAGALPAGIEPEALGRYLAVLELWAPFLQSIPHSPIFRRGGAARMLEPTGWSDAWAVAPPTIWPGERVVLEWAWMRSALGDPAVARSYTREVRRISAPSYLRQLQQTLGRRLEHELRTARSEWPNIGTPWEKLENRQGLLRMLLSPPQLVQAVHLLPGASPGVHPTVYHLEVSNLLSLPVEVLGFRAGSRFVHAMHALPSSSNGILTPAGEGAVLLRGRRQARPEYAAFAVKVPQRRLDDGTSEILVVSRLVGDQDVQETPAKPHPAPRVSP